MYKVLPDRIDVRGLRSGGTPRPQVLGRRGSRMIVDYSTARTATDDTGLDVVALDDVFTTPTVFLGIGKPNAFLAFPTGDGDGWQKYAAFMFWRSRSAVVPTKGRVQSGVFFELPDLPAHAAAAISRAANARAGRRSITCAWENAHVLAAAGFTCGGRSLRRIVRPSKLAGRVWEHGLELHGRPVNVRVVATTPDVADHFVGVWGREASALGRLVRKLLRKSAHTKAPTFDPALDTAPATLPETGARTVVGISRPSWLGAHLGFAFGPQPIYHVSLPAGTLDAPGVAELTEPLQAYPGKLDGATKLKRYILFSRPVIRFMRAHLSRHVEAYPDVPAQIVPAMMRSSARGHDDAFVYNYVLTGMEVRVKRLENRRLHESKFVQWVLAKHVLISGYDPDVRLAGEVWTYTRDDGQRVFVVNANSGTYKPTQATLEAVVPLFAELFGLPVEIDALPA